jgi:hypothetical protein
MSMAMPKHNPDTSVERLGDDWIYCRDCGYPIRKDEQDTTTCQPAKKREYAKYLKGKERVATIRARMDARERKFREAQADDEWAIYVIEHEQTRGYKPLTDRHGNPV